MYESPDFSTFKITFIIVFRSGFNHISNYQVTCFSGFDLWFFNDQWWLSFHMLVSRMLIHPCILKLTWIHIPFPVLWIIIVTQIAFVPIIHQNVYTYCFVYYHLKQRKVVHKNIPLYCSAIFTYIDTFKNAVCFFIWFQIMFQPPF
jgi:hypothetical protein